MIEELSKPKITNKIVVLIIVIALILTGWLAGHILRFSISSFRHPPIEEITPQIQNGFQPEGIRREVVLMGMGAITLNNREVAPEELVIESCMGLTFFTSLPAKCLTADGKLIRVGGAGNTNVFIPPEK